jgi:hypothetical protein
MKDQTYTAPGRIAGPQSWSLVASNFESRFSMYALGFARSIIAARLTCSRPSACTQEDLCAAAASSGPQIGGFLEQPNTAACQNSLGFSRAFTWISIANQSYEFLAWLDHSAPSAIVKAGGEGVAQLLENLYTLTLRWRVAWVASAGERTHFLSLKSTLTPNRHQISQDVSHCSKA